MTSDTSGLLVSKAGRRRQRRLKEVQDNKTCQAQQHVVPKHDEYTGATANAAERGICRAGSCPWQLPTLGHL